MICPHCGNETQDGLEQCQHCGTQLNAGAKWGVRKSSNLYKPQYSSDTEKLTSFVAATPTLRKTKPQGLKIALGLAAILLVASVGYAGFTFARETNTSSVEERQAETYNEETRSHSVIISIDAPGLDEEGTPIPVQVSGADAAGNAFEEIVFIKSDGTGLGLYPGKYGISPLASPITADGRLFLFNTNKKWFSVNTELEPGEAVDLSEEITLSFEAADPSDLSNEAIASAREYAIQSGRSAEEIDKLLATFTASMAETKEGAPFSNIQTYRNITFIGDVRTNNGFIPASGIPDVQQIPTRTDLFLFTSNTLYYADNTLNSDTSTEIALHGRNMQTGQESILATDLAANTRPCYINGNIFYTAGGYSQVIKRIDISTGESIPFSDNLPWGFSKLVGTLDTNILVASSDGQVPQICIAPIGEGEPRTISLGEEAGNVCGVFDDIALVSIADWSSSKLVAYSLEGEKLWEKQLPEATVLGNQMVFNDGLLGAISGNSTNKLISVDIRKGEVQVFNPELPYVFEVMFIKNGHLYFAGSESYASYDSTGTATANYTTFDINITTSEVTNLGEYEAPQDEDLLAQQQQYFWDYNWNSGFWDNGSEYDTGTTWGDGTDTTGLWGDGTDTTNTWGDGANTSTTWGDGTNTWGDGTTTWDNTWEDGSNTGYNGESTWGNTWGADTTQTWDAGGATY